MAAQLAYLPPPVEESVTRPGDIPAIMSPAQLAKELDVSVRTLERWRADGDGPAFQHPVGTRIYRYYRRDVTAWLENKKPEAATSGQNINN